MKIAHLSFSTLPASVGGLEVVVDRLARHQAADGHDVTVITRWQQWQALREFDAPYSALPLPPYKRMSKRPFSSVGPRFPVAISAVWYQMRHRFDLWHVHWLYPTGWMVNDSLSRMDVPVVMTAHGADIQVDRHTNYGFRQFPKHDRRVRSLVPRAGCLTAISDSIAKLFEEMGANPDHVHHIANGVDAARIGEKITRRQDIRRNLGVGEGTTLIISIGRNEPRKGFHYIPETLAHLLANDRDVLWIIIGLGSEELEPVMAAAGVSANVRLIPPFRGSVTDGRFPPDELAEIFVAADIFAFPSMSEGLPLVSIEAMAAGTPIVGNDVPGIRDMVDDGVNGLLCEARNPKAMANSIERLIDEPELVKKISSGGIRKAEAYDWAEISRQYLELYQSLIKQGGGR
jgi:glycosyltransferase involved in cell wall biosynthesis